jgi:hypothetical protein
MSFQQAIRPVGSFMGTMGERIVAMIDCGSEIREAHERA